MIPSHFLIQFYSGYSLYMIFTIYCALTFLDVPLTTVTFQSFVLEVDVLAHECLQSAMSLNLALKINKMDYLNGFNIL